MERIVPYRGDSPDKRFMGKENLPPWYQLKEKILGIYVLDSARSGMFIAQDS
jgi:hypothetical protein